MGTSNFSYKNRCIVVTDEDYEYGNVPEHEHAGGNRSYPTSIIDTDFRFWNVVLNAGYYEAGCIDYQEKDDMDWGDLLGYAYGYYPDSKAEFYRDMKQEFGLTESRCRKLCDKIHRASYEYDYQYWDAIWETVGQYLMDLEEDRVNEWLDKLMEDYGYEEYVCVARFSNGEAWYSPKKKEGREALLQAVAS